MKRNFFLTILSLTALFLGLVNSCKKDMGPNPPSNYECPPDVGSPTDIGIKTSFTEEFDSVYQLTSKGWVIRDNTAAGGGCQWTQGSFGVDKSGIWHGFTAYSYTSDKSEYAFSRMYSTPSAAVTVSSWMITPVLSIKNGDKISFYTRSDTIGVNSERMQVLLNRSSSGNVGTLATTVCGFTTVLLDINAGQVNSGYPNTWTKYEYTFTGISGKTDARVAFRHFLTNASSAKGIGVDLFKFEVN